MDTSEKRKITEAFLKAAGAYEDKVTAIRRDFHHYAETAWTEFRTTSKIITFLKERGIEVHFGPEVINPQYVWSYPDAEVLAAHQKRAVSQGADAALVDAMQGYTGAMAVIDSQKPGPTVAFRFDIDCNDVDESKETSHRPNREGFASVNPHCMHACGHDGHAAMGMVLAAVLQECRELWCGKVKILYQPSEEGDKGAQSMVEQGLLDDADIVLSMHVFGTGGPYPAIAGTLTGLYATTKFDVCIEGKSAHAGAAPQEGNSAIMAAVHAIAGMQSFCQDGRGATRLNIGTIAGGTGRNVVAENCFFRAETRGSTTGVEKRLYEAAIRSVKASCELFGCSSKTRIMGYGPQGDGDADLASEIALAVKAVPEVKTSYPLHQNTGGTDDFAYMMQHLQKQGKKACYMGLLTKTAAGAHNGKFDFDESCLIVGVKSCLAVFAHYLEQQGR